MAQDFAAALGNLADWFERQKRLLPWRDEPSLYRVWISEIMLQQTQVATVVPYFERFVARFPSVQVLAAADEEEVLRHWAGLGYYSRARNIHRAARIIVTNGFPETREGWLEIPGVGEYTAGAILSIALDQPEAILDGNVERVLSRVRRVSRAAGESAYKRRLWRLSRAFIERSHQRGLRPSQVNQALMELGASFCSVRAPKCLLCPLASICRARTADETDRFPPKKKKKEWLQVEEEVHLILDDDERCLVRRREKGEWRAGLWDLPETLDELKDVIPSLSKLGTLETRHVVTRHKVTRRTHVWRTEQSLWKAAESAGDQRWITLAEPELPVGAALKKTWQQAIERFALRRRDDFEALK